MVAELKHKLPHMRDASQSIEDADPSSKLRGLSSRHVPARNVTLGSTQAHSEPVSRVTSVKLSASSHTSRLAASPLVTGPRTPASASATPGPGSQSLASRVAPGFRLDRLTIRDRQAMERAFRDLVEREQLDVLDEERDEDRGHTAHNRLGNEHGDVPMQAEPGDHEASVHSARRGDAAESDGSNESLHSTSHDTTTPSAAPAKGPINQQLAERKYSEVTSPASLTAGDTADSGPRTHAPQAAAPCSPGEVDSMFDANHTASTPVPVPNTTSTSRPSDARRGAQRVLDWDSDDDFEPSEIDNPFAGDDAEPGRSSLSPGRLSTVGPVISAAAAQSNPSADGKSNRRPTLDSGQVEGVSSIRVRTPLVAAKHSGTPVQPTRASAVPIKTAGVSDAGALVNARLSSPSTPQRAPPPIPPKPSLTPSVAHVPAVAPAQVKLEIGPAPSASGAAGGIDLRLAVTKLKEGAVVEKFHFSAHQKSARRVLFLSSDGLRVQWGSSLRDKKPSFCKYHLSRVVITQCDHSPYCEPQCSFQISPASPEVPRQPLYCSVRADPASCPTARLTACWARRQAAVATRYLQGHLQWAAPVPLGVFRHSRLPWAQLVS